MITLTTIDEQGMQIRMAAVALLVGFLGAGGVSPASGVVGRDEGTGVASDTTSEAQRRAQERRRERQSQRQWISVPELSLTEALPLVEAVGVAAIDVTCREWGEDFTDRIPGAIWQDWTQVEQWATRYEEAKTILVYCA